MFALFMKVLNQSDTRTKCLIIHLFIGLPAKIKVSLIITLA